MTGVVIRRDEDDFSRWIKKNNSKTAEQLEKRGLDPRQFLNTEVGFLSALCRYKEAPVEFDAFQLRFLACGNRFRSMLKSRQVGYSWIMAAEMLARSQLKDSHVAVCVSYNLDDAKEKIALIKELHDELPLSYQKKMCIDSKTEVGFESRSSKRRISRINSLPSKAPRGKSGDVYLDEFAHCLNDKAIYAGATAVTSRVNGQFTVGSTPLGKRGMFYRIHEEADQEFKLFWRVDVPWWRCRKFCTDVHAAARIAHTLATEERVRLFGSRAILNQFGSLPLDDFQQEYELDFQDARVAFFPLEVILSCCRFDLGEKDDFRNNVLREYESVEELALDDTLGPLYAGFDVGRTKHASELVIVEERGERFVERYHETYRDVMFDAQKGRLDHIVKVLDHRLRALRVDRTGLGMNLSENLRKAHGSKVEEWHFTNAIKVDLANNLKILLEGRAIELVKNRDMIGQLGSVKQKISDAGNAIFDVDKAAKHHADKVWALALAVWRKRKRKVGPSEVGVRIIGEQAANVAPQRVEVAPESGNDLSRIFDVDDVELSRPEFRVEETPQGPSPLEVLESRARRLRVSLKIWERMGDHEAIKRAEAELRDIQSALGARRAAPGFILVEATDPAVLKQTLEALPTVGEVAIFPSDANGVVANEGEGTHQLVRVSGDAAFARFAMERQGYARVVTAPWEKS